MKNNPYAPPESNDFGLREDYQELPKHKRKRVILGTISVPIIMTCISFFIYSVKSDMLDTAPSIFAVIVLFCMGGISALIFGGIQSFIFSFILEYKCNTLLQRLIFSLLSGMLIVYSMLHLLSLFISGTILNYEKINITWGIGGTLATFLTMLILNYHRKLCKNKDVNHV